MAETLLQRHDATPTQVQVQTKGFTQLSGPVDNGDIVADVVFVHGLGGHPKDTWTYGSEERRSSNQKLDKDEPTRSRSFRRLLWSKGTKDKEDIAKHPESLVSTCFWPMDLLSRDFKNVRVLTYGYDSHVSHFCKDAVNQVTISQHGRTLLERLIDERQDCIERPLIFVAHSLGGLLVKDAIIESRKHSPQTVARMVFQRCHAIMFFGTPHLGSGLADWGVLLSNIVEALGIGFSTYKGVLRQLAPDSEKLESLTREFNEILNAPIPVDQKIKIYSFQEGKGISASKLLDGKVVPDHSSWFNRRDLERNISISENHKNMCKFKGDNDAGYKAFSNGLRMYLSEILHSKETQTTRPGVEQDETQLKDVFINLATSCDQHFRIHLLVDALDACDEGQLADVLSLFHDDRGASACTIKIAFTSRPSYLIAKALTGTFKLVLEYGNKQDIAKMVGAGLRFFSKPHGGIFEWCTNYLTDHAQGVFSRIFIVIGNLTGWDTGPCTKAELMKLVQDFPLELIDYHKPITEQLAKHDPMMKIEARKTLDWVTYAERPLTAGQIWDTIASMTWLPDIWIKLGRGDEVAKLFKQRRLL